MPRSPYSYARAYFSPSAEREEWRAVFLTEQKPEHCLDRTSDLSRLFIFLKENNFQKLSRKPPFLSCLSEQSGQGELTYFQCMF